MPDNEFGYTRWGMDWVRLAEPLRLTRPEPLLPRARSIARNSGVRTETEGRIVRAHIHRGGRASVTHIELVPLPRAVRTTLREIIGAEETIPTDEMYTAICDAGVSVAPEPAAIDCSCRARTVRCVHVLATFYELARQVDENPRVALNLQGHGSDAMPDDSGVPPPRWTPLHAVDPATFFEA